MPKLTRRACIKAAVGSVAAAGAVAAKSPARKPAGPAGSGIKLAEVFAPGQTERITLARQIGVTHVILTGAPLANVRKEQYYDTLAKVNSDFKAAGMTIAGVESNPVPPKRSNWAWPGATRKSKTTSTSSTPWRARAFR